MAKEKGNLVSFGKIPLVSVVIGFTVATLLSLFLVQPFINGAQERAMADSVASEIAQQLNLKELTLRRQLGSIASSNLVMKAMEDGNEEFSALESLLLEIIPHASRVRVFTPGSAKIEQGYPPFNYTTLDLVNTVESGGAANSEIISAEPGLGGEKWLVAAVPIKSGDKILGTLFAYLNMAVLSEGVADSVKGELRIMQPVGVTPTVFLEMGDGGQGPVASSPLNNPNWTITYTPSPGNASPPEELVLYLIPGLVMLIVSIAGVLFANSKSAAAVSTNLALLGKQITGTARGNYEPEEHYTWPGFADQDIKLKPLADLLNKPPPAPEKAAPAVAKRKKAAEEMVDIEMVDSEEDETEEEAEVDPVQAAIANPALGQIFRAYDIRGIVGETVDPLIAREIGLAIGSIAEAAGEQGIFVGCDGRESSPELVAALIEGLIQSGRDVTNLGAVPTPVLYYATQTTDTTSGVMVTGSHNAGQYNGFKIVIAGRTLTADEIQSLYAKVQDQNYTSGEGSVTDIDITNEYLEAIIDDVVVAQPLKVVVDCGNGIAGTVMPDLLDALGCEAVPLYCDVDGSFPNHQPDPTKPENLEDLILTVKSQEADLGIALDGDGDRLVAVTGDGEIVWPDRLLMLFAKDVVSRNPGSDVVYDVKCTRHLNSVISGFGGRPILCRSGHSYIKAKVAETEAMLGGEMSGHICFTERWHGFDDGLYAAARLLEIVGSQEDSLSQLLKEFPVSVNTPEIYIPVADDEKFELVAELVATADFEDASITTIDGLRVDFADGWGLVRASNTEPALTFRFEADDRQTLDEIKDVFREHLQEVRADLDFPR